MMNVKSEINQDKYLGVPKTFKNSIKNRLKSAKQHTLDQQEKVTKGDQALKEAQKIVTDLKFINQRNLFKRLSNHKVEIQG